MSDRNPKLGELPGKDWPISEPEKGKKKPIVRLGTVKSWVFIVLERITPMRS
jgi:hypothetical protein